MAVPAVPVPPAMYHVYHENWSATVGEELLCQRETGKIHDAFAVSVIRASEVVGHIPSIR